MKCPDELKARLKTIEVQHYNFAGEVVTGEITVYDVVVESVKKIFTELLDIKFPINKMQSLEAYGWDDELSMEDNNSSSFNYRVIAGTNKPSVHSYGLAIDINPLQNPCIKDGIVTPTEGKNFIDRKDLRPGMIESVVGIFKKHGFGYWGGNWNDLKDYQHFQPTAEVVEKLKGMIFEDGVELWKIYESKTK